MSISSHEEQGLPPILSLPYGLPGESVVLGHPMPSDTITEAGPPHSQVTCHLYCN